jgi:hypothetical protein
MQARRISLSMSVLFLTFVATLCHADEDPLQDWAENKKLQKEIILYPAVKNLKKSGLEKPKRVGLISFYLWDVGEYKHNAMARVYGGTYERTSRLTPKGANHFATKLAELGIPALKEAFADHGMELLEPIDFVTTDEQREAYVNFKLPTGKLGGAAAAMSEWMFKNPTASSAAAGYSGINAHLWMDIKGLTALDSLRTQLGLDAVVILANTSFSDANNVALDGVNLMMYGPNPTPRPTMKIAMLGWAPSTTYIASKFGKNFKYALIANLKKGDIKAEHYEGYDVIVKTLSAVSLENFDEQNDD